MLLGLPTQRSVSACVATWRLPVCLSLGLPYKVTGHIGSGSPLLWRDPRLANYTCRPFISK